MRMSMEMMEVDHPDAGDFKEWLRRRALDMGFARVGFASLEPFTAQEAQLRGWFEAGRGSLLPYLDPEALLDPRSFFPEGQPLDWVEDVLSPAQIRQAGFFGVEAVAGLQKVHSIKANSKVQLRLQTTVDRVGRHPSFRAGRQGREAPGHRRAPRPSGRGTWHIRS